MNNPFTRIHQASADGTELTLSPADLDLIMDLLSDKIAEAETEVNTWRERFDDYALTESAPATPPRDFKDGLVEVPTVD